MAETNGGYIPQGISDTLGQLIGLYSQVEAVNLNNSITKAAASRAAMDAATVSKNEQAQADAAMRLAQGGKISPWLIGGGVAVALVLVYLAVK